MPGSVVPLAMFIQYIFQWLSLNEVTASIGYQVNCNSESSSNRGSYVIVVLVMEIFNWVIYGQSVRW